MSADASAHFDEMDFDEFVEEAGPGLRRLGYARTGSWATAEDLVQDAFSDAHRRWDEIGRYDNPTAWGRRAVLNRSVSWFRRRGRERRALDRLAGQASSGPEAGSQGEPTLADEELWSAVRGLSDRQRDVVLLLWFEDLSVNEVADTLGCGVETVRTHWRRARARLALELGETDDLDHADSVDHANPDDLGLNDTEKGDPA